MKYGLSEEQLKEIIAKISGFPEIEEAVLFGSRAIDTFKEASDVDIALKGAKVKAALAAKLKFIFEEDTYLPFFFDFVAYPTITNEKLKEHINKKGVVIYRKDPSGQDLQEYRINTNSKAPEDDSQEHKINTIKSNRSEVRENSVPDIQKLCADNGSEYAFYCAVANNESARQLMKKEKLRELAVVLFEKVRENASIDWTIKESVKAKLKVIVKRILRQFGYPPDMQMLATETVLKQAELIAEEMTKDK
jgi:predicted nucleotidyltransferase